MHLAIDSFLKYSGSKMLILGDMFELGKYSKKEHQSIIDKLDKIKIKAFLLGNEFYKLQKQSITVLFFKTKNDLISEIIKNALLFSEVQSLEKNILIKGSRGMKMEEVLEVI